MSGDRCPGCGHFWTSHSIHIRGLEQEPFCWTAGCDCRAKRPEVQKTVET